MKLSTLRTVSFLGMFLFFTALSILAVTGGSKGGSTNVIGGILAVITGPFVGAVARNFQRCCLEWSTLIMWYCAPVLLLGIALQWMKIRNRIWELVLKTVVWVLGWLAWFGGGLVSYTHAFN